MERRNAAFVDWINLILGVLLIISPFVLAFPGGPATTNPIIAGLIIGVIAIAALVSFAQWEEWINLILGLWVIVSPWVLGFASVTSAVWTHVVIGLIVAVLAAIELWMVRSPPAQMVSR